MDIKGAKVLKDRLGPNRADEAALKAVDVPEDAPPVFHWTGVSSAPSAASSGDTADEIEARPSTSLFRRICLSFR